jgi:hypothetical protein
MAQLLEIYPSSETSARSTPGTPSARTPNRDLKGSQPPSSPHTPSQADSTPAAFNLVAFPPKSPGYYFEAAANAFIRRRLAGDALIEVILIGVILFFSVILLVG